MITPIFHYLIINNYNYDDKSKQSIMIDLWSVHCPQLLRERSGKTGRTMVCRGQKVELVSNREGGLLGKQEPSGHARDLQNRPP